MTWLGQVRHVMAKDVRQARWPLLGYLAIVAAAWARALEWPARSSAADGISMVLVIAAGIFVAGSVVQADSPTRSDAFWGSRPFSPTGVLTAKGLLALLIVIGVPLLAQFHVLMSNDVPARPLAAMLAKSVSVYGLWLLIAMVLAAVTRDIRSFTVALLMLPAGIALLSFSSSFGRARGAGLQLGVIETAAPVAFMVAGIGTAVGLLIVLYRSRTLLRPAKVAAVVAVACTFISLVALPSRANTTSRLEPLSGDFGVVVESNLDLTVPSTLKVGVDGPRPSSRLVMLDSGTVTLRLRDGTVTRVLFRGTRFRVMSPRLPVAAGVRWLGSVPNDGRGGRTGLPLTRDQRAALRAGIASASIEGSVLVAEPRVAFTLPLQPGASARHDGLTARVLTVNAADDDSLAMVAQGTITRSGAFDNRVLMLAPWDTPRYALVNERRGEAVLAESGYGSSSEALILPGAWRNSSTTQLRLEGPRNREADVSADWLGAAKLVVFDWVVTGRASFRSDATVR